MLEIFELRFLNDIDFWSALIREKAATFFNQGLIIAFAAQKLPRIALFLNLRRCTHFVSHVIKNPIQLLTYYQLLYSKNMELLRRLSA